MLKQTLLATVLVLPIALVGCGAPHLDTPPSSAAELGALIDQEYDGEVWRFEAATLERASYAYARAGRADLIAEMLSRGWNPNDMNMYSGMTPLGLYALYHEQPQVTDMLMTAGYTVEDAIQTCATQPRRKCDSVLKKAAIYDRPELLDVALRYNAIYYVADNGTFYGGDDALRRSMEVAASVDHNKFLTALNRSGYDTGTAIAQNDSGVQSDGGTGSAVMGIFGSLAGSALGSTIGGTEGDVFASTLSGIVDGANSGNAVTGTMGAIGQGAGLIDSNTANMLGIAGSLFGGGVSSTQSGAIQRPGAVQREVATLGQSTGTPSNYSFSCPMGSGPHNIPIPASSNPQCISAMRTFAFTATCNLIDEMPSAQDAYYSQCAAEIFN